ncbi:MAG: class I tRNA ligase family protein [Acidimicrobiales bacterium]
MPCSSARTRSTKPDPCNSGTLEIRPAPFRAEALAFVRAGLEDISVSRSARRARGWGTPVPGDASQVIYVWFDALSNYVSALGYGASAAPDYRRWWLRSDERVHVVGKGILRFHCVDLRRGTLLLLESSAALNRDLEETAPWRLAKGPALAPELDAALARHVAGASLIAEALAPNVADLSRRLADQLRGRGSPLPPVQPAFTRVQPPVETA